ncbi:MAG TPA: flagellar hook-associated protein FlgK [Rhizomicrobium sp.]|jgi:flagellar hook-associated protein 1 FlgK
MRSAPAFAATVRVDKRAAGSIPIAARREAADSDTIAEEGKGPSDLSPDGTYADPVDGCEPVGGDGGAENPARPATGCVPRDAGTAIAGCNTLDRVSLAGACQAEAAADADKVFASAARPRPDTNAVGALAGGRRNSGTLPGEVGPSTFVAFVGASDRERAIVPGPLAGSDDPGGTIGFRAMETGCDRSAGLPVSCMFACTAKCGTGGLVCAPVEPLFPRATDSLLPKSECEKGLAAALIGIVLAGCITLGKMEGVAAALDTVGALCVTIACCCGGMASARKEANVGSPDGSAGALRRPASRSDARSWLFCVAWAVATIGNRVCTASKARPGPDTILAIAAILQDRLRPLCGTFCRTGKNCRHVQSRHRHEWWQHPVPLTRAAANAAFSLNFRGKFAPDRIAAVLARLLRTIGCGSRSAPMSLNGILNSALSALQTNQSALGVISNNVANLNTPGYDRRVVNEQAQTLGGGFAGVSIQDVERVANQFFTQEALYAGASSSQYSAQSDIYTQLNGVLGQPGDGTALTTQLDNIQSALGQAELSPNSSTSQQGVLSAFQSLASQISRVSGSIAQLRTQTDQQVSTSVGSVNTLISQIYTLNQQIQTATTNGDDSSNLLDQRDTALQSLSQMIGVRTTTQSNGQMVVTTQDGTTLVGSQTYAQLSYTPASGSTSFGPINFSTVDGSSGQTVSQPQAINSHLGSGQLYGLVQMRDGSLASMEQELGQFTRTAENAYNAQSNANAAFPPPATLNGRDTGLLSTDALNFTGQTTIAVADPNGNLVSRIDVDFDAGTISVDGGPTTSIGSTVGDFVGALNTALGSNGTASFTNGALSISASGGNGIEVQDNASDPSSRGGSGFSQFFGLNDIFRSSVPSILSTGLSASDAGGFSPGTMSFALTGPNGEAGKQVSVNVTAGMTVGDIVNALNTSFGGAETFALGSDGTLKATPSSSYAGYQLNVASDTTQRGTTGLSFTSLFGLGAQQSNTLAQTMAVNPAMVSNPAQIPLGQSSITDSTVAGDPIVGSGDSSGVLALETVGTANQSFPAAGGIGSGNMTLGDYAGAFYQDVATRSTAAQSSSTTASDQLSEAQARQSQVSGVNLDEELSNMVVYQQAYSASARIITTVQQLYDTLLQMS